MRRELDYIDPDAEGLDLTDKTIVRSTAPPR